MKHKMTEADITAQIAQLVAMPDTDIDTADIPEAPIENWALAKRPGLYKPRKKPVTLRARYRCGELVQGSRAIGRIPDRNKPRVAPLCP